MYILSYKRYIYNCPWAQLIKHYSMKAQVGVEV
jgi:hypothetical protein